MVTIIAEVAVTFCDEIEDTQRLEGEINMHIAHTISIHPHSPQISGTLIMI